MDYHNLLEILTRTKTDETNFDEKLETLLHEIFLRLPKESIEEIHNSCNISDDRSVRRKYLETTLHILESHRDNVLSESDTFMSVNQYRTVKVAIELVIAIGIIPCLLPGVGTGFDKLCPNAIRLPQESLDEFSSYDRLVVTTRFLTDSFKEISLRPAILTQLGPLLTALFQLSYAPLMKPGDVAKQPAKSKMTVELYEKLLVEQAEFTRRLNQLIKDCQLTSIMKELMVLLGMSGVPNWLKRRTRNYLVDTLTQPTGITSLINAVIDDMFDIGKHWAKLNTVAKLIATPHLENIEQYYNSICNQILQILNSTTIKHSTEIANSCITALYDVQPSICIKEIYHKISAPFRIKDDDYVKTSENSVIVSENDILQAVDNLMKCFISKGSKYQTLPALLLRDIALPLFHIYSMVYKSHSVLKSKLPELLIYILNNEKSCDELFCVLLNHDERQTESFGRRYYFRYGSQGNVEIKKKPNNFDELSTCWHDYSAALLRIVQADERFSLKLLNYIFNWLLKSYESKIKLTFKDDKDKYCFLMKMADQISAAQSILQTLTQKNNVQKILCQAPESLLSFVTALYPTEVTCDLQPEDYETLTASLLLVQVIMKEGGSSCNWKPFRNFAQVLTEKLKLPFPQKILDITRQVLLDIRNKGTSPHYTDLSVDMEQEKKFDEVLRDLCDPLLPVRAHGLIKLTRLIETSDPMIMNKKELVLCLFQENLKDDDSFVYLAAINGLCALANAVPERVIELLIQQFIDMPQRNDSNDISPENRVKLGEILVKTTRALGDMAPKYKNILINGFLCGVRDKDSMVRASSLSCLGELCKVLGFRLGNAITEVLYCIGCIIQTDEFDECRRAAVLVITLLIRGLGKDILREFVNDLLPVYRGLKYLRDNDKDDVLRLHAQLALEEIDDIVQNVLFTRPELNKNIFVLT